MGFDEVVRALVRNLSTLIVSSIFGMFFMYAWAISQVPQYKSSVEVFISTPNSSYDINTLQVGSLFGVQRVKSYASVFVSPLNLEPVITDLNLSITPLQLAKQFSIDVPEQTVVMRVTVSDSNPNRAAAIANKAAEQFSITAPLLEIPSEGLDGPVKVTIIKPATAATYPHTPRKTLSVTFGLMGGILFSFLVAVTRYITDRSVKNVSHLDGETLLGVVPKNAVDEGFLPLIFENDNSQNGEMYKQIRTILLQEVENSTVKVIGITSALAGEGKTTNCLNIAREFAVSGYRVLVIEADLRKPSLRQFLPFSLSKAPEVYTQCLESFGNQKLTKTQLKRMIESRFGIDFLIVDPQFLGSNFNGADYFEKEYFGDLVSKFRRKYDFIFVDCPPVLPISDTLSIANVLDAVIIIAQAGKVRINQYKGTKEKILSTSKPILGVVLNMVPRHRDTSEYGYQYSYGEDYGEYYRTTPYSNYREHKAHRKLELGE